MQGFLILAHQDEAAVERLVRKLVEVGKVFIHIDKGSQIKLSAELQRDPRVNIFSNYKIRWGHWSMIQATELLADKAIESGCSRVTLLSGLDAPIVSKKRLQKLEFDRADYFAATPVTEGSVAPFFIERLRRKYIFPPFRKNRLAVRIWHAIVRRAIVISPAMDFNLILAPLEPKLGSQFWSVTADTYLSARDISKSRPEIDRYFSSIFAPDEGYFQTLFASVSRNHVNHGSSYAKWVGRGGPQQLEIADIDREIAAGTYFFARKVYSKDHELVSYLDEIWD